MSRLSHYSFLKKIGTVPRLHQAEGGFENSEVTFERMKHDREQQNKVFGHIEQSDYYKRIGLTYNKQCYICGRHYAQSHGYISAETDKWNYGNCRFCYMPYLYCTSCWVGTRCPECNAMCTRTSSVNANAGD